MRVAIVVTAGLFVCLAQVGCTYSTQKMKATASEYQVVDGREALTGMRESETVTQWKPTLSWLGPVVLTVTLGQSGPSTPWYSGFDIVQKEHVSLVNPDGSLKEVHQTEAALQVEFWIPVSLRESQTLELYKFHLYEIFALASRWEGWLLAATDPYRFVPDVPMTPGEAGLKEKLAKTLKLVLKDYKVKTLRFEYVTDIRHPDGTLEKEIRGGYHVGIPLLGGSETVELRNINVSHAASAGGPD